MQLHDCGQRQEYFVTVLGGQLFRKKRRLPLLLEDLFFVGDTQKFVKKLAPEDRDIYICIFGEGEKRRLPLPKTFVVKSIW